MYDFIRKREYFEWWDKGLAEKDGRSLKNIQDAWIMSELYECRELQICEVGGGDSRVLRRLSKHNSCVNADRFEGEGNGPRHVVDIDGVERVDAYLGDFNKALADESFDIVFSISVLEHVPDESLADCFADMARILRPGGWMLHAIDMYVFEQPTVMPRIDLYRMHAGDQSLGLAWVEEPAIGDEVGFHCDYASNSVQEMAAWNHQAPSPALRELRCNAQSCSLKMALVKE